MNVYDIVTEKICTALASGVAPWHKPWVGGPAGAPRNLISQRAYSGVNTLLLGLSGYSNPDWLTYKQATGLGGNVRKGEKSTVIVFFTQFGPTPKAGAATADPQTRAAMLRYYNVFNVEQCDGLPSPAAAAAVTSHHEPIDVAEAIAAGYVDGPTVDRFGTSAWYRPSSDHVSVPSLHAHINPAAFYSTLFHELAHSTGHSSRLDRAGITETAHFGTATYSKEELVAEIAAAFLCSTAGLDCTIPQSASYCAAWLKVLKGDSRMIISAASQASKAANRILGPQDALESFHAS
jgi:antirestriction protein ArdC